MTCRPTEVAPMNDARMAVLQERYRVERDRRLIDRATDQFIHASDRRAPIDLLADPHCPVTVREPLHVDIEVLVLGAGWAGILAGWHLRQAGVADVRIIDMAGDFGGVWYWNHYPGIQCDNDSCCYLPLLEETGFVPSRKFADGPEIMRYAQSVARQAGLYEGALFHTACTALRWDEQGRRWHVTTDRGDRIRARFVIMGNGLITTPKLPGLPGIDLFRGKMFHTSRWDYTYTGGSCENPVLHKLGDKRIAIVGTGATGVQAIPYLGKYAEKLFVIQRTPSTVDARANAPVDPDWIASLPPGWQRERQRQFQMGAIEGLPPGGLDVICDIWTEINRNLANELGALRDQPSQQDVMRRREAMDYRVMERLRKRVDDLVDDPATAESLKPWYRFMCKRPASNDDYYPTFNRPNVELIDVSGTRGVERMTATGFVANGVEYPVDCVIFASGFEVTSDLIQRWNIPVIEGIAGQSLYERWADGYRTLHGMSAHGFPNLFFTGFLQSGFNATTTEMINRHVEHIAYIIGQCQGLGYERVEPTVEAEQAWIDHIRDTRIDLNDFADECTPSYFNGEGDRSKKRWFAGEPYGPGWAAFEALLRKWRAQGDMQGMNMA